jgi:hypothetical protein
MEHWADGVRSVLDNLQSQLLADVYERGKPPDERLRSFIIGVTRLVAALTLGDDKELNRAMKEGTRYLSGLIERSKNDAETKKKLVGLPTDFLSSRKAILEWLLETFKEPAQAARHLKATDETAAKARAEEIARTIFDSVTDEPLVTWPFLVPALQKTKGADPRLLPPNYADKARRQEAISKGSKAILTSKPNQKDGTVVRAAITAVFQAAGLKVTESQLFDVERVRAK